MDDLCVLVIQRREHGTCVSSLQTDMRIRVRPTARLYLNLCEILKKGPGESAMRERACECEGHFFAAPPPQIPSRLYSQSRKEVHKTRNPGAGFNGRVNGFTRVDSARPVADE